MQLQPHFLFNALNTIGSLVRTGRNTVAVNVVARLGRLLRWVLDEAATHEVALKDELAFVRNYLEIERVRFSDRLEVKIAADSSVLDASVPHLILQPLVENAIKHGIGPNVSSGIVAIGAARSNGELQLTVRDNGCGLSSERSRGLESGVGLTNTRARLSQLYGARARLDVGSVPDGGTEVTVALPFRTHESREE